MEGNELTVMGYVIQEYPSMTISVQIGVDEGDSRRSSRGVAQLLPVQGDSLVHVLHEIDSGLTTSVTYEEVLQRESVTRFYA